LSLVDSRKQFCRQKSIKKDIKLKRIESSERVKYILNAARGKFDYDLLSLLTVDDVQEKAQYHSALIAENRVSLLFSVAQDKLSGVFI
jgi:hypothetical protein